MLHEEQGFLVMPRCPICNKGMGATLSGDNMPRDDIDWCDGCKLDHYVDRKYWRWNGSIFTEEQFKKALKLKAFW